MIRKRYNAEVVLTVLSDYSEDLSEQDIMFAAMEAEVKVNSLGYFPFDNNELGISLHIKEEKNGDDQNKN